MIKITTFLFFLVYSNFSFGYSYNCKTTENEYLDLDLKILISEAKEEATVYNLKVKDEISACFTKKESEALLIFCESIVYAISDVPIDIEGGNAFYQTADGNIGFMICNLLP